MDWEQRFCPNQYCTIDFWSVQQSPHNGELWHLVGRFGGHAFTVAAVSPVCPRCGTALCLTIEHAPHIRDNILEAGPVLEFVRSLR
jgi:hypothetical protein